MFRASLAVQWLRLSTANSGGVCLIPGWRNNIPHAARCGQKIEIKMNMRRKIFLKKNYKRVGLSWWLRDNLPASAGDTSSIPDLGRSNMPWSN